MVAVGANLFKREIIPLLDRLGGFQNRSRHARRQEGFAVFDRKDEVIVGIVYVVVAMRGAHAHRIPENRAFSDFRLWNPAPEGRGILVLKTYTLIEEK